MRNRTEALRIQQGADVALLPTEFDADDALVCRAPTGFLVIPASVQNQAGSLLEELQSMGLNPMGCFNCIYFTQSGMQQEADPGLGYCLEGKLGIHVDPLKDGTTMEASCDAHCHGSVDDQAAFLTRWADSIR